MSTPRPALAVAGNIPQFVLSDRLRKARESAEMTQSELADVIGISRRSVSYYESGESAPKRPQLIAWAMATGVSLSWLETGQPLIMRPSPTTDDQARRVIGRSQVQVLPREHIAPVRSLRTGASASPRWAA